MRPKSVALLVLALGCGLVASVGITQVLDKRNRSDQSGETGTVYVAAHSVAMGETLNPNLVRTEEWPKDKIPQGAVTKLDDLEGRRCITRLMAGEPIFRAKLSDKMMGVSPSIPKGFRLVTVKVDAVSGSGSMILPGDRVDVLVHMKVSGTSGTCEPLTRTILQYVKVFAVDAVVSLEGVDGDGKSIAAKTVSLLCTPDQAQRVALASELGSVRLVLRPIDDAEQVAVTTTTPTELLGLTKAGDTLPATDANAQPKAASEPSGFANLLRAMATKMAQSPKAKEPEKEKSEPVLLAQAEPETKPQRHVMRLLLGTKCSEVVLEAEADPTSRDGIKGFWRATNTDGNGASTPAAEPTGPAAAAGAAPADDNNKKSNASNPSPSAKEDNPFGAPQQSQQ